MLGFPQKSVLMPRPPVGPTPMGGLAKGGSPDVPQMGPRKGPNGDARGSSRTSLRAGAAGARMTGSPADTAPVGHNGQAWEPHQNALNARS